MEISFKSKFSVFSICFLCNVVRHADIVAWSIIRPQFKEDLKFTSFVLGVIDMMFLFSYAIGNIISGSLGDSYDSKKVLCLGMMGSGVSQCFILILALFLYDGSVLYCLLFGINGMLQGSIWVCTVNIMGNWFSVNQRGKVMGFWMINPSVGNFIGSQLASGLMSLGLGWQLTCIVFLYFFIGALYLVLIFIKEIPVHLQAFTEEKKRIPIFKALMIPNVLDYSLIYGCVKLLQYSFLMWLPFFIYNKLQLPEYTGGVLASLFDVGGIIGSIAIGWASDKLSNRAYILFPLLVGTVPLLFSCSLASNDSLFLFYVLIPFLGLTIGSCGNLISSVIATDLGMTSEKEYDAKATIVGLIDGTGGFGAATGQIVIGLLQNYSWTYVFVFIFFINILAVVGMVPLIIRALKGKEMQVMELESD